MSLKSTRYRKVEPATLERRTAPRHDVKVTSISLNGGGEFALSATLVDISIYGCRLKLDVDLEEGQTVDLSFATFNSVKASIVWQKEGHAGCRFHSEISPFMMRSLTLTH